MEGQKIRIKLKAYDHYSLDKSTKEIARTVPAYRRPHSRTDSSSDQADRIYRIALASCGQEIAGAIRNANS